MGRMLLGMLVVVMLSLTGYVAYSTFGPTDGTATDTSCEAHKSCCSQSAPSCCSETKTEEAPACCQEKAACCETKGEAGTCCQSANKAKAIVADKKVEEPKAEAKKD